MPQKRSSRQLGAIERVGKLTENSNAAGKDAVLSDQRRQRLKPPKLALTQIRAFHTADMAVEPAFQNLVILSQGADGVVMIPVAAEAGGPKEIRIAAFPLCRNHSGREHRHAL